MMTGAPLSLDESDFIVEHLLASSIDGKQISGFAAGNNAFGLEVYLKDYATNDERAKESRTYLVRDAVSNELACYFSLRTCLVPIALCDGLFSTVPAIELSNFAVNERYKAKERAIQKVGAYVLAAFIRPIAQYVSEFVGAKWLCIYALPDDKLIGYYGKLGFSRLPAEQESFVYSHVKPKYDDGCIFMYQPL